MPYPKDPNRYPSDFYDMIATALKRPVRLTHESKKKAVSFRHKFNSFRVALKETNSPFYIMSNQVEVIIEENVTITRNVNESFRTLVEKSGEALEEKLEMETEEEKARFARLFSNSGETVSSKLYGTKEGESPASAFGGLLTKEEKEGEELPAKRKTPEEAVAKYCGTKEGENPFSAFGDLLKKPEAEKK